MRHTSRSVLRDRVLVLNRNWTAIGTCTVRRAIVLMLTPDADGSPKAFPVGDDLRTYSWDEWATLDPGPTPVHSPTRSFRPPQVVVVRTPTLPRLHPTFSRLAVLRRDNYTCVYCGRQPAKVHMTIDHVQPRSRGGKTNWLNCVACCRKCNMRKDDRTPDEAGMPLLVRPVRPPLVLTSGPVPPLWWPFLP